MERGTHGNKTKQKKKELARYTKREKVHTQSKDIERTKKREAGWRE